MFGYNNNIKLDNLVRIKSAQVMTGKFDWIEGDYRPVTWGNNQQMLMIEFSSLDNRINHFYLTDRECSQDFQHTVSDTQQSFFLPLDLDKLPPLDKLQIIGVKLDSQQSSAKLRPVAAIVGKSMPVSDAVNLTQKVISLLGSEGHALRNLQKGQIKLEHLIGKNDAQISAFLKSCGFSVVTSANTFNTHNVTANPAPINDSPATIPEEFLCFLTKKLMSNPVICRLDGKIYQESDIREWLEKYKNSPCNCVALMPGESINEVLTEHRVLAARISEFRQNYPQLAAETAAPSARP